MTTGMQSSDTPPGVRVNCLCYLLFNFGEDLSYCVILRYKLHDFIKIYDDFVNDQIKRDFQKTLLLFQMDRKSLVEYKWLWLHTTRKSLLGLFFLIDNQTV